LRCGLSGSESGKRNLGPYERARHGHLHIPTCNEAPVPCGSCASSTATSLLDTEMELGARAMVDTNGGPCSCGTTSCYVYSRPLWPWDGALACQESANSLSGYRLTYEDDIARTRRPLLDAQDRHGEKGRHGKGSRLVLTSGMQLWRDWMRPTFGIARGRNSPNVFALRGQVRARLIPPHPSGNVCGRPVRLAPEHPTCTERRSGCVACPNDGWVAVLAGDYVRGSPCQTLGNPTPAVRGRPLRLLSCSPLSLAFPYPPSLRNARRHDGPAPFALECTRTTVTYCDAAYGYTQAERGFRHHVIASRAGGEGKLLGAIALRRHGCAALGLLLG
jgi:hypothetical protein